MAEAHTRDRWNHTAALQAMLYNANRGRHASPKSPADFHPCPPRPPKTSDLSFLRQWVPDDKAAPCPEESEPEKPSSKSMGT